MWRLLLSSLILLPFANPALAASPAHCSIPDAATLRRLDEKVSKLRFPIGSAPLAARTRYYVMETNGNQRFIEGLLVSPWSDRRADKTEVDPQKTIGNRFHPTILACGLPYTGGKNCGLVHIEYDSQRDVIDEARCIPFLARVIL